MKEKHNENAYSIFFNRLKRTPSYSGELPGECLLK